MSNCLLCCVPNCTTMHMWLSTKGLFKSVKRATLNCYLDSTAKLKFRSLFVFNPWPPPPPKKSFFLCVSCSFSAKSLYAERGLASRYTSPTAPGAPPPYLSGPGKNTEVLRETSAIRRQDEGAGEWILHFSLSHSLPPFPSPPSVSSQSKWIKGDQLPYSPVLEGFDYRGRRVRKWVGGGEDTHPIEVTQRTSNKCNENIFLFFLTSGIFLETMQHR